MFPHGACVRVLLSGISPAQGDCRLELQHDAVCARGQQHVADLLESMRIYFSHGRCHSIACVLEQIYGPLLDSIPFPAEEMGKLAFLTITESRITDKKPQRPGELHIENPGLVLRPDAADERYPYEPVDWGLGEVVAGSPGTRRGGIYIASNVRHPLRIHFSLYCPPAR